MIIISHDRSDEDLQEPNTQTDDNSRFESAKPKLWRVEINDPRKSTRWKTLSEIDEDDLAKAEEMRDEENKTNAPALIRIVRKTQF